MTRSTLLTIEDLINELNMGKATLKFILHRFSPWLTTQIVNNETYYTEQAVTTLLKIKKFIDTGMLPEQIETSLAQEAERPKAPAETQYPDENQGAIQMGLESVSMFKDMFQAYIEKQDRIASAQESLARIEERKANAMEKRAAAEEKKADAMTNIAQALQAMNQRHSAVPEAMKIAGRALENIALEESPGLDENLSDTNFDENEYLFEDPVPMEDPFKDQDHEDLGDIGSACMDDLSLLVNETALTPEDIDDLSSLIDSVSDPYSDLDDLESLLEETPSAPETNNISNEMDDLSKLVDPDLSSSNSMEKEDDNEDDIDDLFSLVGMDSDVPKDFSEDLDDLSKLIEHAGEKASEDLDDLSALIDEPAQPQAPMDDLSRLIDPESDARTDALDDLSALVEKPKQPQAPMDDLSLLVNGIEEKSEQAPIEIEVDNQVDDLWNLVSNKETASIKPDISPDQDMKKYKAAVMKIIIELKEQGLAAQQTTDRLNRDDVATLSGKPAWSLKAIEKIYGFIDSAK
ncbi:MerR family transcriptional regulator [Desulfobacter curvatus]|uniref:MerR family transcriptional regulator n=1 Tax=Desulfobacter curvatus TaxID=2290 RepID=UPI0003677C03|nr:MerR family transcriptional regulator [Desulfobacter curvatus]